MKRVLHVFGCLDCGGAETMIMNHYRTLDRSKIQFDFVTHFSNEGFYEKEILELGGRIFRLPRFKGYNICAYYIALKQLFIEHKEWDTIHVHIFTIAGIILPIAQYYGIKTRITHCHSTSSPIKSSFGHLANRVLRSLANKFSTHRMACSHAAGSYYFKSLPFHVIPNAIQVSRFIFNQETRKMMRAKLNLGNSFTILMVGRFNEVKNHAWAIDVFCKIYNTDPNAKLMFVGDGPLLPEMTAKAQATCCSSSILFQPACPDIPQMMMASDILILPSLYEGLGIVAIEAQASGLPTFISDGVPDATMVTELAHKISLQESPEVWANEILKHQDNAERKNMYNEICGAGYNVQDNIKWLENFYLNEK